VRDDSGAYEGAEISSYYDPLISKLCVWAPTRELAVRRMRRALSEYVVTGIRTNVPFHLALMTHPEFVAGRYDTGFVDRHGDALLAAGSSAGAADALALGAAIAQAWREHDAAKRAAASTPAGANGSAPSPWRLAAFARM
ncbi:MAG TPA: hypothetical protein VIL20_10505, partial [Sandaracinaceae bacterium]